MAHKRKNATQASYSQRDDDILRDVADVERPRAVGPPHNFADVTFWRSANRYQFIYSVGGLILGFTSMIGGMVLFLHGVAGSTSWTAKILGASSQITDAAPGAILFIVGLFMVYVTRYVVKVNH